jgi:hypothetical protein
MTTPVRVGELLPGVLTEVVDRAGHGYARWAEQVVATGYCAHPVRLRGRVEYADAETGAVRTVYSTSGSRMPPCSRRAATGRYRCAPPARRPTRPTASSSWPPGCEAARASPRPWPPIRGCS